MFTGFGSSHPGVTIEWTDCSSVFSQGEADWTPLDPKVLGLVMGLGSQQALQMTMVSDYTSTDQYGAPSEVSTMVSLVVLSAEACQSKFIPPHSIL